MNKQENGTSQTFFKRFMKSVVKFFLITLSSFALLAAAGSIFWYMSPSPQVFGSKEISVEKNLSFNAPFHVSFSTKMDRKSVENAISISPSVEGSFEWQNDQSLFFRPNENLEIDKKYIFSVSQDAKSWLGKKVENRFSEEFYIVGPPQVVFIAPISASEWQKFLGEEMQKESPVPILKPNDRITLSFDRPIRSLKSYEEEADFSEYLEFSPAIEGKFRYLGSSALEFVPDAETLLMGQKFTATLKKGFPSADGGMIENGISWNFETPSPQVLSTTPVDYSSFINPSKNIEITWNQEIDIESLFDNILITPDLPNSIRRTFEIKADGKKTEISFKPSFPKDELVKVHIKKGVKSKKGTKELEGDYEFSFTTLADPRVISFSPNSTAVAPESSLGIVFSTPVDEDVILDNLVFSPEIDKSLISVYENSRDERIYNYPSVSGEVQRIESIDNKETMVSYTVDIPLLASQKYSWELKGGFLDTAEQKLEKGFKSTFQTKDYKGSLSVMSKGSHKGIYDKDEDISIFVRSRNIKSVHVVACELSLDYVARMEAGWGRWGDAKCDDSIEWDENLALEKNEWTITEIPFSERVNPSSGIWFYTVYSPEYVSSYNKEPIKFYEALFLSSASLTAKISDSKILFWATDFITGESIADMKITLYSENGSGGKVLYNKTTTTVITTDENGLAEMDKKDENMSFFAAGEKGDKTAFVSSRWDNGISTWDFSVPRDWQESPHHTGYLFTDRPIYRPGHTVEFKGIIRSDKDAFLSIPKDKEVAVQIESPTGKIIYEETLTMSENGTIDGSLVLGDSVSVGQYYLTAKIGDDWINHVFWVEEYRKPDFKIDINSEKYYFLDGQNFTTNITASRYFGAKMPNAKVSYHVIEEKYYFDKIKDEWFNFSLEPECWWYCETSQEVVYEDEGETDENGELKINFPISLVKKSPRLFTLRTTIIDETSRTVSKSETFEVYPSDVLVGIRSENYFISGTDKKARFSIITVNPEGEEEPTKEVEVVLYRVDWNSIQKQGVDGNYYWESEKELVELDKTRVMTSSMGRADVVFNIDSEDPKFKGRIQAIAQIGNSKSSADSYISSSRYTSWRKNNNDRIDIVVDKKSYKVGDIASLLVKSPFEEKVKALVTIERKDILSSFVTEIESGKALEIPITEEMIPNAYVSVVLFKGKGERYTKAHQFVETKDKLKTIEEKIARLEEAIASWEEEETSVNIEKSLGKSKAELVAKKIEKTELKQTLNSLQEFVKENNLEEIMAESAPIPEMKMGMAELNINIDEKRLPLQIDTSKEKYLPGEKVEITVYTLPNAEITIAVVDESVLALKSRSIEDIVDFFWGRRGVGVSTVQSMVYFIEKLSVESQKGEKGGGGGARLTASDLATKKRGEFKDTAHFEATLIADSSGKAVSEFTLPDNLTTWQILAIASSKDSRFGATTKNFISRKEVMITPSLPRFVVHDDVFTSSILIHNQSKEDVSLSVSVKTKNLMITTSQKNQKITILKGSQKLVSFEGKVQSNMDKYGNFEDITIDFKAENIDFYDELEVKIPVLSPAIQENLATSGMVRDLRSEFIRIPSAILGNTGNITLTLSAIKTGNITQGLEKLIKYPYGCAEQIMSRHLPNIEAERMASLLGIESDESFASENLQKIYTFQRYDGGFGYWTGSIRSYPYLSAYILFGLLETEKAGYSVDQNVISKTQDYLHNALYTKYDYWTDSDRAFALFVLTQSGKEEVSALNILFEKREEMSLFGRISLLLSAQNLKEEDTKNILLRELEAQAKQTARGVQFEEKNKYSPLSSSVRTTAFALFALSREDPNHVLLPKIVDYLQSVKQTHNQGGPWGTTQNTAWVLISYIEWLANSEQLDPNFTAEVMLNNQLFAEKSWNEKTRMQTETFIKDIEDLNKSPLENELSFQKTGEGKLFYDIEANYYLPVDLINEKNQGVGIVREYFAFDDEDMEKPIQKAKKGDIVRGQITILIPESRNLLVVDSPLPAGLEAINFNLETSDMSLLGETSEKNSWGWWWDNLYYFNHREIRDDRVLLFADQIPSGVYKYKFLARATTEGEFQLLPTIAEEMYHPETFGRTSGIWFYITD